MIGVLFGISGDGMMRRRSVPRGTVG